MIRKSRSFSFSLASRLACSHCPILNIGQDSLTNSLFRPGAIFFPISAASITMVPEPHIGSRNGRDGVQRDSMTRAAAIVSLMGASLPYCL